MRSSARSRLGAAAVFASIAVAVVGGMAWATAATLELRKISILEDYDGKINTAVNLIDSYVTGIRTAETLRSYQEYSSIYDTRPLAIWSREGLVASANEYVQMPSPLFEQGPPHDWIDLYFQVAPDGKLTSPQVLEEPVPWLTEGVKATAGCEPRICRTWEWLSHVLPKVNLAERFDDGTVPVVRMGKPRHSRSSSLAYQTQRSKTLRDSSISKLPQPDCVNPGIASRNINDRVRVPDLVDEQSPTEGEVEIKTGGFGTAFWLAPEAPDGPKLAFVRECTMDAAVFYQGFVGDWSLLKANLLGQIEGLGLFDDYDLVPIAASDTRETGEMVNLPVKLVVPGIPGGALRAAWHQVRWSLIPFWIMGFGVLVVAGVGLRNLVLLTERRMQFAYSVTHELRTPLTTFRLYSDMLAADLVPDAKKREYLETLNLESQRLSALVEDVLEYARLENHNVRLNPSDTNAAALLETIAETLNKRCADNGIQARSENGIANGLVVRTDVDVVHRIAGVLVNNACRHARGANDACVVVELSGNDHELHLDVSDTGPGVARADQHRIFKPFRRGSKAEHTAQGGIGLGLALARDWAYMLGGKLELVQRHHPRYGGAHFRLTIPTKLST